MRRILGGRSGAQVVQRDNGDTPPLRLPEPTLTLPRPRLALGGDLDHLRLLLNLTPQLVEPLRLANPRLLDFSVLPASAPAAAALAAQTSTSATQPAPASTTTSGPTSQASTSQTQTGPSQASSGPTSQSPTSPTQAVPTAPAPSTTPAAPTSVPSSATLLSHGVFNFRIVFEQPSVSLPPDVAEREERFRQAVQPSEPGIDTGQLIKGLITAFLTTTPPGQEILRGITGALGGGGTPSGPSLDLNLDVIPTPILEGQPPTFMLGLYGTF